MLSPLSSHKQTTKLSKGKKVKVGKTKPPFSFYYILYTTVLKKHVYIASWLHIHSDMHLLLFTLFLKDMKSTMSHQLVLDLKGKYPSLLLEWMSWGRKTGDEYEGKVTENTHYNSFWFDSSSTLYTTTQENVFGTERPKHSISVTILKCIIESQNGLGWRGP